MKFLLIAITLVFSSGVFPNQASAQRDHVSYQIFYDQLSPYGQWIEYPNYGHVWIPDAGRGFAPYASDGYWIHTRYGWTWMSEYNWGWAPFHYGRWDYDSFYGWFWVPGYEWGPSWVNWRSANGYYGWQPMRPGYGVYSGFYNNHYNNFDHWTFVRQNDFGRSDIYNYYVNRSDYPRIIENSSIIDNTVQERRRQVYYISGPDRRDVERISGNRVRSVTLRDTDTPGQQLDNNRLQLYRPLFNVSSERDQLRIPVRIENRDIRQLPPDNRRPGQSQQETTPELKQPVRQIPAENRQINRGEGERVQPVPPGRVPLETPGRQSLPVRESQKTNTKEVEKVQTSPPARVPLETPRRNRQPVPETTVKKKEPEH
jgi:hypothetical protein